ncbi:TylF/MycF/NovP-related O-methyltransferase, partial [Bacillus sp. D-CC]
MDSYVFAQPYNERQGGKDWPRAAHSMVGRKRMNQL